jgi:hypothetical protein
MYLFSGKKTNFLYRTSSVIVMSFVLPLLIETVNIYKKRYKFLVFALDMPLCCVHDRVVTNQRNYFIYDVLSEDELHSYMA